MFTNVLKNFQIKLKYTINKKNNEMSKTDME